MENWQTKPLRITKIVLWITLENFAAIIGLIVTGLAQLAWYYNVLLVMALTIFLSLTIVYNYGKVIEGVSKLTTSLVTNFTESEKNLRNMVTESEKYFSKKLSDQTEDFDKRLNKHSSDVQHEIELIGSSVDNVKFVLTAMPTTAMSAKADNSSLNSAEFSPSVGN